MDTVQTAISKEDALQKDMGESNACQDAALKTEVTTCAAGDNEVVKPASDGKDTPAVVVVGSEKVAGLHIAAPSDSENSDDLLDKIEAVVKEDGANGNVPIDTAIATSSEQDFIKQLEEAEAEAKARRMGNGAKAPTEAVESKTAAPAEQNVSSSDEREKAGKADEPDSLVPDSNVDSTSAEVKVDTKAEAKSNDLSEKDDAEGLEADLLENPIESDEKEQSKEVLQNGEVDASPADEEKVESSEPEVSSKSDKDIDDAATATKTEECKDEGNEAEAELSNEPTEIAPPVARSNNAGESENKKSDTTQPMSVDQSPETAGETMDVDEEENMEVDSVEGTNDEEMPQKDAALAEVPASSTEASKVPVESAASEKPAVEESVAKVSDSSEATAVQEDKTAKTVEKTDEAEPHTSATESNKSASDKDEKIENVSQPQKEEETNKTEQAEAPTSSDSDPASTTTPEVVCNSTPAQKSDDTSPETENKKPESAESKTETDDAVAPEPSDSTTDSTNETSQQCNGTPEETDAPAVPTTTEKSLAVNTADSRSDTDSCPTSCSYEINLWCNNEHDIRLLSVENLHITKSDTTTTQNVAESSETSSNGAVSSTPPEPTVPKNAPEALSKLVDGKPNFANTKHSQHTVAGVVELCNFMIDQFTKIKNKYQPPMTPTSSKASPTSTGAPSTPKLKGRLSKKDKPSSNVDEIETPSKKDKRGIKRSLAKTQSDDEDETKSKQSKTAGKSSQKPQEVTPIGLYCVLAKWVDKKYYAGRVTEEKSGNKFVVLFEDGASKVLPKESIVFGDGEILPLKDQSVHALLDDDYEKGVVKSVEKTEEKVIYTVDIDGKEIKVSGSDIYLTDQQAKIIQNLHDSMNTSTSHKMLESPSEKSSPSGSRSTRKRPASSPITPEAGFSGGASKRGGRKQKRTRVGKVKKRASESSDVSDGPEAPPPPESPQPTALEAIEGVQPEVQKTPRESAVCRVMIFSDYMLTDPSCDVAKLIGGMPVSKTLFKGKSFMMTCTVTQKLPTVNGNKSNAKNAYSHNLENGFSNLPLIKEHLKKQIEYGGGKVYDHFEDLPKNKYRQCRLIASRPCRTAKYIQCLAADVSAVSHEWIIDCCKQNTLIDNQTYCLPSGWSIILEKYIQWKMGKSSDCRQSNKPFQKENILIASENQEFVTFWGRVCKMAGATLRFIKSLNDVTATTTGYIVTEQDFPQPIKSKAEHYGIPIVSTSWIMQSLILGKICDPHSHPRLTQLCHDDDF